MDRVGRQRGREVARGDLDRSIADGEQAVAGLDRSAYVWFACLARVDAEVVRERLIDHAFARVDDRYWSLHLPGQLYKLGRDAEPVRIRIREDRWRCGTQQSFHDPINAGT